MAYRLARRAEDQVDRILLESAREWGVDAAARYHRLMLAVWAALGRGSALRGVRPVPKVPGVMAYPLRLGRRLVQPPSERVGEPRHIVVFRIGPDGVVEVLGLVHDKMLLSRAARHLSRDGS